MHEQSLEKNESTGRAIAAYSEFCKWQGSIPLFSFNNKLLDTGEFHQIFSIEELPLAIKELYNQPPQSQHPYSDWVKAIKTFLSCMEWSVASVTQEPVGAASNFYAQLQNHISASNKSKPVHMVLGGAEIGKRVMVQKLSAIRDGARFLFVTEASSDILLTFLKTAGLDLTQTNVYVAEPALIPTDSLSETIFIAYLRRYGEIPTNKFWDILSVIDAHNAQEGVTSRFVRPLNFFRLDPDGASLVRMDGTPQRSPLSKDFATLLAARKIVSRTAKVTDDYGRAAAARWVRAYSGSSAPGVSIDDSVPMERRYRPENWNGEQILYLHGGGLVYYDVEVFSPFLSRIAQDTGAEVIAVGYDKVPEKSANCVIDDLIARIEAIVETTEVQSIVGDSIGGLLALYSALRAFPQRFNHAVLLYPVLSIHHTFPTFEVYGEGYLLDSATMRWFRSLSSTYFRTRGFDPLMLPAHSLGEIKVSIFSAGCDVLAGEAYAFSQALPVYHYCFTDLPHDFCLYSGKIGSAQSALSIIIDQLRLTKRKK